MIAKGRLWEHRAATLLLPILEQAELLARTYDAVVTNPPYMGSKYFSSRLKTFTREQYSDAKADLCTCFIQCNGSLGVANGFVGMITLPNWMFLSSFEELRKSLLGRYSIDTFLHNGRGVFGSDFGSCAFTFRTLALPRYRGTFRRLFDRQGSVASNEELSTRFETATNFTPVNADFSKIPGCPIAYWANETIYNIFANATSLGTLSSIKQGLATCNNELFIRTWQEVSFPTICFNAANRKRAVSSSRKWFPYNKGGQYQRWYGNRTFVVNWEDDGRAIHDYNKVPYDYNGAPVRGKEHYFRESISWSKVTIGSFATRYFESGFIFDVAGCSVFPEGINILCNYSPTSTEFE